MTNSPTLTLLLAEVRKCRYELFKALAMLRIYRERVKSGEIDGLE